MELEDPIYLKKNKWSVVYEDSKENFECADFFFNKLAKAT